MRKRDYLITVLLIAGFAFGFSAFNSAPVALAYQHANPPFQDPTYESPLTNLIDGGTAYPTTTYPAGGGSYAVPGGVQTTLFDDGVGLARFPEIMPSLGTLALAAGAFYVGWKIGRVIDTKWLGLSGNIGTPFTSGNVTGETWCNYVTACFGVGTNIDALNSAGYVYGDAILNFQLTGITMANGSISNTTVAFSGYTCTGCNSVVLGNAVTIQNAMTSVATPGTLVVIPASTSPNCSNAMVLELGSNYTPGTGNCTVKMWKAIDVKNTLVHTLPQTFTNQRVDVTTTLPTTSCGGANQQICAPSATLTLAQLTTIRSLIASQGSTDPAQDVPGWVNCQLAPQDYTCPDGTSPDNAPAPFTIPQPFPNENYNDYVTRLRQLGFMGTIVFLDDPGYDGIPGDAYDATSPAYILQPGTVTGVGVGTGSGAVIPLYNPGSVVTPKVPGFPAQWPGPSTIPTITPATTPTVVIQKVPASWAPPAGAPAPSGSPAPPPGSQSCHLPTIPAVNFTPLTGISFGNQFPFGVITWITTVFGWFNVGPQPPSWDFNMSGLSAFVPGFSAHYSGSLTAFSPYMSAVRTIISFALWIGAIWYVGVSWIGFRGGGDVSEAADDGYDD